MRLVPVGAAEKVVHSRQVPALVEARERPDKLQHRKRFGHHLGAFRHNALHREYHGQGQAGRHGGQLQLGAMQVQQVIRLAMRLQVGPHNGNPSSIERENILPHSRRAKVNEVHPVLVKLIHGGFNPVRPVQNSQFDARGLLQ